MQRHKSGDWDEKENREDDMFLQVEKEIWKEMYPHHIIDLEEESESDDDVEASVEESEKVDINEKSDEDNRDDKSDGDSSCSSSGSDVVVLESKRRKKKHWINVKNMYNHYLGATTLLLAIFSGFKKLPKN